MAVPAEQRRMQCAACRQYHVCTRVAGAWVCLRCAAARLTFVKGQKGKEGEHGE